MGSAPVVFDCESPLLNPRVGKLFRLSCSGLVKKMLIKDFVKGNNIIESFHYFDCMAIGTAAVEWFNTFSVSGSVLAELFDHWWFSEDTWNLQVQLLWTDESLSKLPEERPRFVFLNVGKTHFPYWHAGASWERWSSPCALLGMSSAVRK